MKRRPASRSSLFVYGLAALALAGCDAQLTGINLPDTDPPATPTGTPADPAAADTLGFLDVIDGVGGIAGWALSKSLGAQSIQVEIYVDGDYATGVPIGSVTANLSRPDVNQAIGVPGD